MKTFTDNAGRTWTIDLTIGAAKRVRDLLKIDLLAPLVVKRRKGADGRVRKTLPLVTRLQLDVVALIDVIYVLIKPQADAQGVTDEQFGQALGGEAACAAYEAFMGEWRGFFQELRREAEAKAIDAQLRLVAAQMKKAVAAIERAEAIVAMKTDEQLAAALAEIEGAGDGPMFTDLPPSPASDRRSSTD